MSARGHTRGVSVEGGEGDRSLLARVARLSGHVLRSRAQAHLGACQLRDVMVGSNVGRVAQPLAPLVARVGGRVGGGGRSAAGSFVRFRSERRTGGGRAGRATDG